MISFFRRLRRKWLTENQFSKYLLYAIGEILLVVIGIVIALQINIWNENRIDKRVEQSYITRLLQENKKDLASFTGEISRLQKHNSIILSLSEVFKDSDSRDSLLVKRVEEYVVFGTLYPNFVPSVSTYEDLSSTGNLSLISDTELREKIVAHYEAYKFVAANFRINADWAVPIDAPLFTDTDALKFEPKTTSMLFPSASIEARALEIRSQQDVYLRNAAVHFWINEDCLMYLEKIKKETFELIETLEEKISAKE
jgi:hypothetical protein